MRYVAAIATIVGMLSSVQAIARDLIIEPRLSFVGGKVEFEASGISGSSDLTNELNFGVQVLVPLNENLSPRFGLALGKIKPDTDGAESLDRFAVNGGAEYNFVVAETHRVYGLGQLVYNQIKPSEGSNFTNLNLDIGLGAAYKVDEKISIGAEFTYSLFALMKHKDEGVETTLQLNEFALFAGIAI